MTGFDFGARSAVHPASMVNVGREKTASGGKVCHLESRLRKPSPFVPQGEGFREGSHKIESGSPEALILRRRSGHDGF
ncbi:hypothetical protein SAMN05216233_104209 [Desulfoluna spongiiphila]|uniref:Uncharacterized protein n=1 Tax=Desulfoluna spongiiphila TaxID=419481 RepID=A0A1G5DJ99_9BACT|nr:hypothetical protein SAMN05216233_104209 [Desulfoluna spongiiphila]VVS95114.1 consensus disorder prediction [Desulfoluna spongiiphila]